MKRNLVLLVVPPVVALALLAFFHESEVAAIPDQATSFETVENTQENSKASQKPLLKRPTAALAMPKTASTQEEEQPHSSPLSPIEQIRAIKNKTALHEAVLKDHETFTRYPSDNVRFDRLERDPVSMVYETHERTTESNDGTASITAWSDKKYLLQGESVQLSARVDDGANRGIQNKMMSALYLNESLSLGTFELVDNDNDGTYSLTLASEQTQNWQPGIYKALIASDHKALSEAVSFVISPPIIELTGEYREHITTKGDLLFEIEVNVAEPARFYVRASLYTSSNSPVGSAQFSDSLSTGEHWIPLTYFGLMIRDSDEPGPYLIQTVELAKAGVPMLRMPPAKAGMYTQSYPLEEFSNQTYQEQQALK
ncbi:hypothetical protein A3742_13020 [Oleiphilus sp. HI0071]|uniref:hypothetical protein n=2 Tax=Oleiphilus sp. HI0080 TaxID=1822255 RepID=UPI0007C32519|nr:hypothetical protein [Oleiphilus sp. HI0080]KZY73426.1 hypothetical protein A3737_09145 [Oleiphilus sp. HI0065]KZY80240.1 hypothetical protein A3742_13020 [Oleiphilus sp. HI0071]KZZ00254.1 hypothetical protein A3744_29815 [Oleiphilus sp. HI0073]KZZ58919.1 hypothetical protein A3760_06880 [Oleiphilus sp. HI0122]KZZ05462.1 hypothetical protein A3744_16050 [Oleiphilus sp. HI0073]